MKIGKNPLGKAMKAAKSAGKKAKKAAKKAQTSASKGASETAKKAGASAATGVKGAGMFGAAAMRDGAAQVGKGVQGTLGVVSSLDTSRSTLTPAQANRFFKDVRGAAAKAAGAATVEAIKYAVLGPAVIATVGEIEIETPFRAARGAFNAALTVDPLNDSPNEAMGTIGKGAADDVGEGIDNNIGAFLGLEARVMPMAERAGAAVEKEVLTGEIATNVERNVRGTIAHAAGGATRDGIRFGVMGPIVYLALLDAELASPLRAAKGGFKAALTTDPFNDDLGTTLRTIEAGAWDEVWKGIEGDVQIVTGADAIVTPAAERAGEGVEDGINGES